MKHIILGLLLLSLFTVVGCEGFDLSQVSDRDLERIADKAIVCEEPYMRFETGCCLDRNANSICDNDEGIIEEGAERPASISRPATDDSIATQRPQAPADSASDSTTGPRSGRQALDIPSPRLPDDTDSDDNVEETSTETSTGSTEISDTTSGNLNEDSPAAELAPSSGVRYRLFAEDRAKIGYHLQFYGSGGVIAAFGIKDVVDDGKIIVELFGEDYDDASQEVQLGDTISLLAEDGTTSYSITVEDIYAGDMNSYVDVAITSTTGKIQNRLFAEDRAKIGYHLQFYSSNGVVAAFGIKEVVDDGKIVVELFGKEYDDAFQEAQLRDTISLLAEDNTEYSIRIDDVVYFPGSSIVDVAISKQE
ncbi:hypothetical protein HYT52_02015 [Candidatus Woesearchaeota archaeon]|nr:hypothetical protein [Candidatus Woesearchaeota archaeon]